MQPNGPASRNIVATFSIAVDEAGNTQTQISGPFPIMPLHLALSIAIANCLDQLRQQQLQAAMQQQALQKRVLLPDGSAPPPGM